MSTYFPYTADQLKETRLQQIACQKTIRVSLKMYLPLFGYYIIQHMQIKIFNNSTFQLSGFSCG